MLFSEAHGRKVVSTDTAVTVGKIADFVVDPRGPGIVALLLARTPGDGTMLPWQHIMALGVDAVTVASADAVITADEYLTGLAAKPHGLLGKRVLSTDGVALGTLNDVDFDPATGRLAGLLLDTGPIDAGGLLGMGSYAVIVRALNSAGSSSDSGPTSHDS